MRPPLQQLQNRNWPLVSPLLALFTFVPLCGIRKAFSLFPSWVNQGEYRAASQLVAGVNNGERCGPRTRQLRKACTAEEAAFRTPEHGIMSLKRTRAEKEKKNSHFCVLQFFFSFLQREQHERTALIYFPLASILNARTRSKDLLLLPCV